MEKTEFFVCRCHDISHQLFLGTFEPTEDEERVVYGSFHLVHLEFWDKLKSATKYLFGRKRKDGDFDALLLRPEDAGRLEWFANFFLTSSSCHPKFFVKEFCYFLMSCHQHCLGINLLVQR